MKKSILVGQPAVTRLAGALLIGVLMLLPSTAMSRNALVLQSDFVVKDAAVAPMKGVAVGVSPDLDIHDLTHDIPYYNIWVASLLLVQAARYWPKGTVFGSDFDPGVGT